jgi:hypothetical protein
MVSVMDPYGGILGLLDSSCYFSIKYLVLVIQRQKKTPWPESASELY